MIGNAWIGVLLGLIAGPAHPQPQSATAPAYVREGDRVEQEFRAYRDRLDKFYASLRTTIERDIPAILPELEGAPPQPVVYGYQLLPHIVDNGPLDRKPVTTFSYSWPITQGYIDGEGVKLDRILPTLQQASSATGVAKTALVLSLINSYRELLGNQRVIDQYIEYNRLWQRAIADERPRYDEMTKLYKLMQEADPNTALAIRQMLGQPLVPSGIQAIADEEKHRVVLRVPVYTDIANDSYLTLVKLSVERVWQSADADTFYAVDIDFRKVTTAALYEKDPAPERGDHIDMKVHTARFPSDGVILTTGAEMTNAIVKRYLALGPGDISERLLAHEFGHLLGFPDGYI